MSDPQPTRGALPGTRAAWTGTLVAAALVVLAFVVPPLTGWDVATRAPRSEVDEVLSPPLHGWWEPKLLGPGTVPALVVAVLGWRWARTRVADQPWARLLATASALSLAWCLSLALVDGASGLSRVLGGDYEYLPTAREVDDVGALLEGYVERIPIDSPGAWPTHVAGHPPLMLLFFVGLVRLGLGGDLAAGVVVTVLAASLPVAAAVALRALGAEAAARAALPVLTLSPVAVFVAVSADALAATVAAWGLACLALATRRWGWAVPAGLLLGTATCMAYGVPLLGFVALAVLAAGRSWRPLPVAVGAALVPVLALAAAGYAWWEAYPVLHDRYWDGIAEDRPASYWLWGNLAALALVTGPAVWGGLGVLTARARPLLRPSAVDGLRPVVLLALGAALAVTVADLSRMSKSEVERIWIPFVPWLSLAAVLLPPRWRARALAAQLVLALLVQHLLYTSW
ncbi:hypothetical protein [Nocardioides perillae]|uniref:Glycosyltransferase RgtA/B/C/D-like domain-containing protein n=1 Tax=Nocardioides perillae TaxID=1119534 RepID=A0A7Y9RYA6_9ACTN|nr:hypothetical protein [Nocardioides perillae]NYG56150.1 hypothetical protein [Nocardioides perillae]